MENLPVLYGMRTNYAYPQEHVPEAERCNRVLKNGSEQLFIVCGLK
jgi:hypothetical protein